MDRILSSVASLDDQMDISHPSVREFRPNAETLAAFAEIERGEGKTCNTIAELLAELNAED